MDLSCEANENKKMRMFQKPLQLVSACLCDGAHIAMPTHPVASMLENKLKMNSLMDQP